MKLCTRRAVGNERKIKPVFQFEEPNQHYVNNPDFIASLLDMDPLVAVRVVINALPKIRRTETAYEYVLVIIKLVEWCYQTERINEGRIIFHYCESRSVLQPLLPFISRWHRHFKNRCILRNRKYVPLLGQGVVAQEPKNGMHTTLKWLKAISLHKYWPMISNFSYKQILSINNETIDGIMESIGGSGLTTGARNKLIKHVKELNQRAEVSQLPQQTTRQVLHKINVLRSINDTPLNEGPETDGSYLLDTIKKALYDVVMFAEITTDDEQVVQQVIELLGLFTANEIIYRYIKDIIPSTSTLIYKLILLSNLNRAKTSKEDSSQI